MRPTMKAGLMLVATFALGIVAGALGVGAIAQRRPLPPPPPRGAEPMGFVRLVEDIVQPRDPAQRERIRPLLEATDRRNRGIVDSARVAMQVAMDSLRAQLAPMLDAEQLARFDDMVRRQRGDGRGPPGLGGRGRRGGPPPDGPPPP